MTVAATSTPFLELDEVSIGFGPENTRVDILKEVNLKVNENEFVAIIGFSGAGKSTLVSLLAGLERPTSGKVRMEGQEIVRPGPRRGVMFQSYSLLPWLTVFGNIQMAVKQVFPKYSRAEVLEHTERYIEMVHLTPARDKRPHELSGGMRQRVSLARTLSMQIQLKLADPRLVSSPEELESLLDRGKTVVLITNDVDEAILMADRIIPLTMGPEATLADPFPVTLERPRDRRTLTDQPEYQRLKAEITSYLVGLNKEAREARGDTLIAMPDVTPKDFKAPSKVRGLKWKLSN